jgi:hypothetical protein
LPEKIPQKTNFFYTPNDTKKKDTKIHFTHDYLIGTIKRKYIKECDSKNIRFMDKAPVGYSGGPSSQKNGHIGDSPYIFPFNQNKLTSFILEELQKPFDVNLKKIAALNDEFATKFPFEYIPMYIYDSA